MTELLGIFKMTLPVDCSQSPIFPWDFRDLNASIELLPSLFVRAGESV